VPDYNFNNLVVLVSYFQFQQVIGSANLAGAGHGSKVYTLHPFHVSAMLQKGRTSHHSTFIYSHPSAHPNYKHSPTTDQMEGNKQYVHARQGRRFLSLHKPTTHSRVKHQEQRPAADDTKRKMSYIYYYKYYPYRL